MHKSFDQAVLVAVKEKAHLLDQDQWESLGFLGCRQNVTGQRFQFPQTLW